jgi:hypothetical protein
VKSDTIQRAMSGARTAYANESFNGMRNAARGHPIENIVDAGVGALGCSLASREL